MEQFNRNFYGLLRIVLDGKLPPDFKGWSIACKDGTTIAHFAAMAGTLPDGFEGYNIADRDGWTVAHEAAVYGNLPDGFHQLALTDNEGVTVEQVLNRERPCEPDYGAQDVFIDILFDDDDPADNWEFDPDQDLIDSEKCDPLRFL